MGNVFSAPMENPDQYTDYEVVQRLYWPRAGRQKHVNVDYWRGRRDGRWRHDRGPCEGQPLDDCAVGWGEEGHQRRGRKSWKEEREDSGDSGIEDGWEESKQERGAGNTMSALREAESPGRYSPDRSLDDEEGGADDSSSALSGESGPQAETRLTVTQVPISTTEAQVDAALNGLSGSPSAHRRTSTIPMSSKDDTSGTVASREEHSADEEDESVNGDVVTFQPSFKRRRDSTEDSYLVAAAQTFATKRQKLGRNDFDTTSTHAVEEAEDDADIEDMSESEISLTRTRTARPSKPAPNLWPVLPKRRRFAQSSIAEQRESLVTYMDELEEYLDIIQAGAVPVHMVKSLFQRLGAHFEAVTQTLDDVEVTHQRVDDTQKKMKRMMDDVEEERREVSDLLKRFQLPSRVGRQNLCDGK